MQDGLPLGRIEVGEEILVGCDSHSLDASDPPGEGHRDVSGAWEAGSRAQVAQRERASEREVAREKGRCLERTRGEPAARISFCPPADGHSSRADESRGSGYEQRGVRAKSLGAQGGNPAEQRAEVVEDVTGRTAGQSDDLGRSSQPGGGNVQRRSGNGTEGDRRGHPPARELASELERIERERRHRGCSRAQSHAAPRPEKRQLRDDGRPATKAPGLCNRKATGDNGDLRQKRAPDRRGDPYGRRAARGHIGRGPGERRRAP